MEKTKQVVLIILDGWGHREEKEYNAIYEAKTPNFDLYWKEYPHALLNASGLSVGLPEGQMGNSEVGHTTIGAGKVVDTDLVRISKAINNNELGKIPAFVDLFNHVKKNDSVLHVKGLIGPGGVHSHHEHLYGFLKAAKEAGIEKIAIHAFMDGRDTSPQSGAQYLKELEDVLDDLKIGFIATASGRFYAMDRDNNWDRMAKAEDALFHGTAKKVQNQKPSAMMEELYQDGIVDEHLEPVIFLDDNGNSYQIKENDGIFFFNFRADRARMLSQKILEKAQEQNLFFVTLTEYDKNLHSAVAFAPVEVETTIAKEVSSAGLKQAHIAETEKFAHATYFLNGGVQEPYKGEEHVLLDSRKDINTHDLAPKMRAEAIADKSIEYINKGTDFIFINFANADMVGHTAKKEAIIEAVEEVDYQLKRVVEEAEAKGAICVITADHGNAEMYIDLETQKPHTAHTINLVPFIVTEKKAELISEGGLADIAPTVLELMGLEKPGAMTGISLIKK